jgi:F0F1-type ATP synthase assembly protein I
MDKETQEDLKGKKEGTNRFIKYSSLAFEMGIIIFLGAFGGDWLDRRYDNDTPWFTIGLSLFSVIGSMYLLITRVINDNK